MDGNRWLKPWRWPLFVLWLIGMVAAIAVGLGVRELAIYLDGHPRHMPDKSGHVEPR